MPNTPPLGLGFNGNPLASDESMHSQGPNALGTSNSPLPLGLLRAPASPLGLQAPQQMGNFDMAGAQQQIRDMFNAPMPSTAAPSTESQIFFSPSTGDMVVNGFRFNRVNVSPFLITPLTGARCHVQSITRILRPSGTLVSVGVCLKAGKLAGVGSAT